jgi:hypothetical protein
MLCYGVREINLDLFRYPNLVLWRRSVTGVCVIERSWGYLNEWHRNANTAWLCKTLRGLPHVTYSFGVSCWISQWSVLGQSCFQVLRENNFKTVNSTSDDHPWNPAPGLQRIGHTKGVQRRRQQDLPQRQFVLAFRSLAPSFILVIWLSSPTALHHLDFLLRFGQVRTGRHPIHYSILGHLSPLKTPLIPCRPSNPVRSDGCMSIRFGVWEQLDAIIWNKVRWIRNFVAVKLHLWCMPVL